MHPKRSRLSLSWAHLVILLLLAAFVSVGETQPRPATLTPSVSRGAPGTTFRIDVDPVIGLDAERASETRIVLRPSQARGPQSDLTLRTVEYHGAWFLVQIPRDADLNLGPCRLLWLNRRGDVLASSGDRLFRIVSTASAAPQKPSPETGAGPRPSGDIIRAKDRPTAPGERAEARDTQGMTAPGIGMQAQRLPLSVSDYIAIVTNEFSMRTDSRYPLVFSLPADARLDDQVVLTFMANPDEGGVQLQLYLEMNGTEIKQYRFQEGANRALSLVFHARVLRKGRNELVMTARTGGLGLRVDNVVLWFHRDIAQ